MSGSLLPLKTYSSAGVPLWAAAGSGGGGGGSGSTITVSTLVTNVIDMTEGAINNVSSIVGNDGFTASLNIAGDLLVYPDGATVNDVVQMFLDAGPQNTLLTGFDAGLGHSGKMGVVGYSTIGGNQTVDTVLQMDIQPNRNGELIFAHGFAGLSTIGSLRFLGNTGGAVLSALPSASGGPGSAIALSGTASTITFLPQIAQACHSLVPVSTNTTIPQSGAAQNLGAFASQPGHIYDVRLPVRIDAVSQPTAGDFSIITTDSVTAVSMATFDMTSVSTVDNQFEVHICGTVLASGGVTTIQALGKLNSGTSTTVTVAAPSLAYIRDLGIPQAQ